MDAAPKIRGGGTTNQLVAAAAPSFVGASPNKKHHQNHHLLVLGSDVGKVSIISCNSSSSTLKDDDDDSFMLSRRCWKQVCAKKHEESSSSARRRMSSSSSSSSSSNMMKMKKVTFQTEEQPSRRSGHQEDNNEPSCNNNSSNASSSILNMGCDVMANIFSFLEPCETLHILTLPLSKAYVKTFTNQDDELWRTLCVDKPFHAGVDDNDAEDDNNNKSAAAVMNKYRIMYTNFVRCMRYLKWIQDEQQPTAAAAAARNHHHHHSHKVLPQAAALLLHTTITSTAPTTIAAQDDDNPNKKKRGLEKQQHDNKSSSSKKPRYANSILTDRLLRLPSSSLGEKKTTTSSSSIQQLFLLPYSCAVYSIINWMTTYSNVEGIQTKCLETLAILLEHDEQQRVTAQRGGLLGNVILRAMVNFPNSPTLHTACFHALVLLARPLGGQEGALFKSRSMTTSYASEIFGSSTEQQQQNGGIGVLLDSMRRFQNDEMLQAMGCWSMVNLALIPAQRKVLIVKHGAIQAITRAMTIHSTSAQVQHRALFALVNLVIPSSSSSTTTTTAAPEYISTNTTSRRQQLPTQQQQALTDDSAAVEEEEERALLDASVEQIVQLVVLAMKTFCSSPDILNRACLVLRNLSLISDYHHMMLFTPHCYEMLQYSERNFSATDRLLHASASGTLHHLQVYLHNSNEIIRARFAAFTQEQQWSALELAYHEAASLYEQEQRLLLSLQDDPEE